MRRRRLRAETSFEAASRRLRTGYGGGQQTPRADRTTVFPKFRIYANLSSVGGAGVAWVAEAAGNLTNGRPTP